MSSTQEQVESFYRFATEQLGNGGSEKSIDELYDEWRLESLGTDEFDEDVAAIRASIQDMNCGAVCRNAHVVIGEIRQELAGPESQ